MTDINWGSSGETVFTRTYSRTKPDGTKETWPETVARVARGNLELVYGDPTTWGAQVEDEYTELFSHMLDFRILPAGRHLWASGVKGRQFLMNCWTAGWTDKLSEHFEFSFLRLMEGGGVGANYSSHFLKPYGAPRRELDVHIVCDPAHPDYDEMREAGVLSSDYDADWAGAFEVEDSREGWATALVDLLDTFMEDGTVLHRQRVYDVSRVRGRGSRLKTFGGTASGPAPFATMMHKVAGVMNFANRARSYTSDGGETWTFAHHLTPLDAMEIDHAIAECVVSGGNRRSARMSIVRWDDPFIFEFIAAKSDPSKHWTTNISVEVDDEFLRQLTLPGDPTGAKGVHQAVVKGMLSNGEPGYWNSSLSNHGELEPVYCTNPCGEITLHPFEPCCLAHVNLDAFAPKAGDWTFDEAGLQRAHELVTRFAIRATFGDINDEKSRAITDKNRRIGVGHFGVQGFVVKNGWSFTEVAVQSGTPGYHAMRGLLSRLHRTVRDTARSYAFDLRIPEPIKVTTVAPTGSIAKLPGVTEGIHPIYARYFERRIRFSLRDDDQVQSVNDAMAQGFVVEEDIYDASGSTAVVVYPTKDPLVEQVEALGYPASLVESADEIGLGAMLAFQEMYQSHYADNAVSYTITVNPGADPDVTADTLAHWLPKLKGTTVFPDASRPQSPYTRITEEQYEAALVKQVEDSIDLECATGACPIR